MIRHIKQWVASSALAQAFDRPPLSTELFTGVEKPTVTLAKMLVLEMMQNVDTRHCVIRSGNHYGELRARLSFPTFECEVHDAWNDYYKPDKKLVMNIASLSVKDSRIEFSLLEKNILLDGIKQWLKLYEDLKSNEAENRRQQQAIDAIEKLFKPKEVPEDAVHKVPSGDGLKAPLRPD